MSVVASPRASTSRFYRRLPRAWSARIALAVVIVVLLIAMFGPYVSPHSPDALGGIPYMGPGHAGVFGTDLLGRDVLSRVLSGGRTVVLLALAATAIGYIVGATAGLIAGFSRTLIDPTVMRIMDVLLAFPPILFLLIIATGAGHSLLALTIGVAVLHVPGVSRIIRAATLDVRGRGYVEAAVARGESTAHILFREILPNIRNIVVADAGPRFTVSILLVAAMNFLGLGQRPPAANWALMISENKDGLTQNPWAVLIPALMIAVLTISVNILADAVVRQGQPTMGQDELR